jgi:hypothetical protein
METVANKLPATSAAHNLPVFPPLEQVTRPTIPTDAAAFYLNRQPQTLRSWASLENGALRPVRIFGRLAWNVAEIKSLLNGGAGDGAWAQSRNQARDEVV